LQEAIGDYNVESTYEDIWELWDISTPPTLMAKSCQSKTMYGNHFKVGACISTNSMATYDLGIMDQFEHTPPTTMENQNHGSELKVYVGECNEILELDYEVIKVNVLLCFGCKLKLEALVQVCMKVIFHFHKPNIHNLSILSPIKVLGLSELELHTFG